MKSKNRVKFFQEPPYCSTHDLDGGELETKTNVWLEKHPDIIIKNIAPASYENRSWCIIWYTEEIKK